LVAYFIRRQIPVTGLAHFDCHVGSWHVAAFAALHQLGRDWTTTDKRSVRRLNC